MSRQQQPPPRPPVPPALLKALAVIQRHDPVMLGVLRTVCVTVARAYTNERSATRAPRRAVGARS